MPAFSTSCVFFGFRISRYNEVFKNASAGVGILYPVPVVLKK